jgi:hypothetical protein
MPSTTQKIAPILLVIAACQAQAADGADAPAVEFDRWGILAADLSWTSPDRLASWMPDEDWSSFGSYYTEDLYSGYGGALGRYEWGEDAWRFSGWSEEGPRARHIDWRSDRFGVYEAGMSWATDSLGFDRWSERARYDWAGSTASGSGGWFPF